MGTIHNNAAKDDIAKVVLMCGDPLRVKELALKYLDDVKLVNDIRNNYAYTGFYKGKRVTIMAHGMGIPSMGIYTYELFNYYNVDKIIRLGTCGVYNEEIDLLDIILVDKSYTESNFSYELNNEKVYVSESNTDVNKSLEEIASKNSIKLVKGDIFSSDCFDWYVKDLKTVLDRIPNSIIGVEMESFALFYLASKFNRKASCLLTVVDSHCKKSEYTNEEMKEQIDKMALIALESL